MSLTLGLIVWFYEKQKTTRKPSGKRKKNLKKGTRPWEKKKENRQAGSGKK